MSGPNHVKSELSCNSSSEIESTQNLKLMTVEKVLLRKENERLTLLPDDMYRSIKQNEDIIYKNMEILES